MVAVSVQLLRFGSSPLGFFAKSVRVVALPLQGERNGSILSFEQHDHATPRGSSEAACKHHDGSRGEGEPERTRSRTERIISLSVVLDVRGPAVCAIVP